MMIFHFFGGLLLVILYYVMAYRIVKDYTIDKELEGEKHGLISNEFCKCDKNGFDRV